MVALHSLLLPVILQRLIGSQTTKGNSPLPECHAIAAMSATKTVIDFKITPCHRLLLLFGLCEQQSFAHYSDLNQCQLEVINSVLKLGLSEVYLNVLDRFYNLVR